MPHRSRQRRWLSLALAAATTTVAALATGCASGTGDGGGGVTLTFAWWGNDARADLTTQAVRLFEKKHPGVTVRTSSMGYGGYVQKLATQAAGNNLPDVFQLDYRQLAQYARSDRLKPLDPYLREGTVRTKEFDPTLLHTGRYGNTQYALPMGEGTTGVPYDAKLFAKAHVPTPEPGWTWQDWADAARKISALHLKGPGGADIRGTSDVAGNEDMFEEWLRSRGKKLYASEKKLGFTAKDLATFWTFTSGLRREGAAARAKDTAQATGPLEQTPMGRGLAAMDFSWDAPWLGFPAILGDSVHIAPVPTTKGRPGQYLKPSMLVSVARNSAHPQVAAQLVDFLLNDPEVGKLWGFDRSTPPNRRTAAAAGAAATGPQKEIYEFQRRIRAYGVKAPPPAPAPADVSLLNALGRQYQRVAFEEQTPAEAARDLVAEMERELRS
ncbi:extracellular solute-binding protein [Streptomyces sp. NPDC049954]|uniref:ABC transporter substrate-binding protein n=1 Tax=Streptomyces sp. NPDC049954 TaxID=3155779 RepID=UPI00341D75E8